MTQINTLEKIPESLLKLKSPPKKLYFIGDTKLLDNFKVAIVGTRKPNQYTKNITALLAQKISKYATIVSGGAIGVDCIAHTNSFPNTIMISPSSLEIIYPKENMRLIKNIAKDALILSEYEKNYMPQKYSFLERNRIVIALSDIVILPQGDINSGTSSSARIAEILNKLIFTLPHRYKESQLTNHLIEQGKAKAIYDIDNFIKENIPFIESQVESQVESTTNDEILDFCKNAPSFEMAFSKFGNKILEYEFLGLLERKGNIITIK
ncbi:hypothetical protein CCY99_01190 [Helicobacter sp. 16-1353]|uniref:DNA-processing protein DprA n=1 Tax=Helicobacter sp. 16-1353 TaxID=2004996 RepID=UPI000DCF27FE|nr:DNA-processing protein DprA [Helicobacter sp. 16-1353]RAX55341.1 hypothetical protein CCY99_01190 [Helicobacter sp. 16-1353]